MKKIINYINVLLVLTLFNQGKVSAQSKDNLEGRITLSGAFALYPMAIKWSEEFKKIHPKVKIDISAGGAGKGITDALASQVDIGMVSRDINLEELKKGAFAIAVTKDAVVATISASNPKSQEILTHGLRKSAAVDIWISGKVKTWAAATGIKGTAPLHVYTRSDAAGAAESWAKYFGKKQEDLLGVGVFGDPGLAQAVKSDALAIGFNNIGYAYDSKTKKQNPGIRVLPLDLNNNGKIDPDEDFYGTIDQLIVAISTNKYPSPPARDLYFVTKGKPKSKILVEFINWVLTDGQKYVNSSGYITLPKDKLDKEIAKIK